MLGIVGLLIWNVAAACFCYFRLRRRKHLFDGRHAATIASTATLGVTLILGMHVTVLLSAGLSLVFLVNLLLGAAVGTLFGGLFNYHLLLAGLYNGLVGISMGIMIGEVLKNPQICSIPISDHTQLLLNMYQLCGFATLLLTVVVGLVLNSIKA
ncbi:hypothetical protein SAMN04488127_1929 [Bhargavaea ginsengi]|uniref:Uncharacterized protein n=1 Tax=Bhargavaea ginsengi TaxID=426757 RepID=A0A1H6Z259_9BACL|nr:hypothetical protein [Bhargavaea ginsengi]MCM3086872.1 hypothetical protein [Bhargavaea ginsengi]SEJ47623.1 hypothetical protein SAMN04488127_1929 [Bhargavaea ginsengi]